MESEIIDVVFLFAICTLAIVIGLLQDRVAALEAKLDEEADE